MNKQKSVKKKYCSAIQTSRSVSVIQQKACQWSCETVR